MKNQELHLLYVFDAIMLEGSVTRAAKRLAMTQPAVSNAIARMRDLWSDPLFVKSGRQIEPTAFALSLWEQVREPIHDLANAINASSFDPGESRRKFRIALSDSAVDMFWLPMFRHISEFAPSVDLYAMPFTFDGAVTQLREAHVDLAIGPLTHHDRSLRSTPLFDSHMVLTMRKDHPLAKKGEVSLTDFLAAKHMLVSHSGDARGIVDAELQRLGLRRRVALTVNHFSAVPKMLMNTDLIAVVPEFVAGGTQYRDQLWLTPVPIPMEPTPVYVMWHARHDKDPGLIWVRDLLIDVMRVQMQKCSRCAKSELPVGEELATLI